MNEVIAVDLKMFTLTPTRAEIPEGIEFKEWVEIGRRLSSASRALQWWIGDWLNYGVKEYGSQRAAAHGQAHVFGLGEDMVRACMWVSDKVANRIATLSWTHHREVAGLSHKEQKQWLTKADHEKWSVSELRQALRVAGREVENTEQVESIGFNPLRAALDLKRWVTQQDVSEWDTERRKLVKQDLEPIVQFWQRL